MSYYNHLPRTYFSNYYDRITRKLNHQESVLVSAIVGGGSRTALNLFRCLSANTPLGNNAVYLDADLLEKPLPGVIGNHLAKNPDTLFVVRNFHKLNDRRATLEKINSIKLSTVNNSKFLFFADHTAITDPTSYMGESNAFFAHTEYLAPFDLSQTEEMIAINNSYFGWEINTPATQIWELSGGIPRLIKYICLQLAETGADIHNLQSVQQHPAMVFQLNHLSRIVLTTDRKALQRLGLLNEQGQLNSSLLSAYMQNYQSQTIQEMFPQLSNLELQLLTFLYENQNQPVPIERIGDLMELHGRQFSPWAIYKLVSRIKPKIVHVLQITTVKGKGYMLKV